MATSNSAELVQSVEKAIKSLTQTYEDIGFTGHEKEQRTANVFKALQDCLKDQLNATNKEKEQLVEECTSLIQSIRQMEKSLEDYADDQSLRITLPLLQCRRDLREKMKSTTKRHQQKFEEIMELSKEMRRFADALEPSFLKIELPPADHSKAVGFNLSSGYTNALNQEFSRVEQEFYRRSRKVTEIGTEIVQLWAELGTHTLQTDRRLMQCYKDAPEQLGLKVDDIRQLQQKLRGLREEKASREQKISELSEIMIPLWEKLNIDDDYRHQFLATHRGVSHKTILEIEQECERLQKLKHDNLHIFIEDARQTLQRLWDELYFSEDEMLEFTAAFTDEYTEALLEVHEAEIAHLEQLLEERQPMLNLIDRHRSLLNDKEELAISQTDSSRLMSRGGTGVARDPTRLLREERMRKRIAKELPRVEAELRALLEEWEEEYGKPFTVKGEDYLEMLVASTRPSRLNSKSSGTMAPPPPRTPSTPGPTQTQTRSARSQSVRESKSATKITQTLKHAASSASTTAIQRSNATTLRPKTPVVAPLQPKRPQTSHANRPKTPTSSTVRGASAYATITKTPNRNSRPALTTLTHEPASPERGTSIGTTTSSSTSNNESKALSYKNAGSIRRKLPPPPVNSNIPPKMGKLAGTPTPTPGMRRGTAGSTQARSREGSIEHSIRAITPPLDQHGTPRSFHNGAYLRNCASMYRQDDDQSPLTDSSSARQSPKTLHPRAFSGASETSSATAVSSENWETYDDSAGEEEETHIRAMYYHKLRAAQGTKSPPMEHAYRSFGGVHQSPLSPHSSVAIVDDEWDD